MPTSRHESLIPTATSNIEGNALVNNHFVNYPTFEFYARAFQDGLVHPRRPRIYDYPTYNLTALADILAELEDKFKIVKSLFQPVEVPAGFDWNEHCGGGLADAITIIDHAKIVPKNILTKSLENTSFYYDPKNVFCSFVEKPTRLPHILTLGSEKIIFGGRYLGAATQNSANIAQRLDLPLTKMDILQLATIEVAAHEIAHGIDAYLLSQGYSTHAIAQREPEHCDIALWLHSELLARGVGQIVEFFFLQYRCGLTEEQVNAFLDQQDEIRIDIYDHFVSLDNLATEHHVSPQSITKLIDTIIKNKAKFKELSGFDVLKMNSSFYNLYPYLVDPYPPSLIKKFLSAKS